jgi:tRNA-modifying protein YgfZ
MSDRTVTFFDRSDRLRMEFSGPKAAESLNGLLTNDVLSLRGGDGLYACALTPKGRIIADVRVFAFSDSSGDVTTIRADTNAVAAPGFAAMIKKYVNPRVAKYVDVSSTTGCLTITGDKAASLLSEALSAGVTADALSTLPAFGHIGVTVSGVSATIARVPDLADAHTFDLLADRSSVQALTDALVAAGASLASPDEWRRLRVLAAQPEWGVDMDESTLAQEANMDLLQAISYTKGCYTGQETVARVHFRGHVNRTLRVVQLSDTSASLTKGAELQAEDGTTVGDLRSTAHTDAGALVGIAMLRREVADGAVLVGVDANRVSDESIRVIGAAAD